MSSTSIYGCWLLDSCRISFSDDRPIKFPFQRGMISYHSNAHITVFSTPRPKPSMNDLERGHKLSMRKSHCISINSSAIVERSLYIACPSSCFDVLESVIGTTLREDFILNKVSCSFLYYQVRKTFVSLRAKTSELGDHRS